MLPDNSSRYAEDALRHICTNEDYRQRVVAAATTLMSGQPDRWIENLPEGTDKEELKQTLEVLQSIPSHDQPFEEHQINPVAKAVVDLAGFVIEQQSAHETREKIARGE